MFEKFGKSMSDLAMDGFMSLIETILIGINKYSFNICLLTGMIALILYVYGYKKGKTIASVSPAVYVILQIVLKGWFGV